MEPHLALCSTEKTNEYTSAFSDPPGDPEHPVTDTISLSRYFPKGTAYFYGYPSGDDSRFFNNVPPASEELVAARSLICAGEHVQPIVFGAAIEPSILRVLRDELGVSYVDSSHIVSLPQEITPDIVGTDRNAQMKSALQNLTERHSLIMAQPYLDSALHDRFQIEPELTVWLNDKKNLHAYVPEEYLAARYAAYQSGKSFSEAHEPLPTPCVVKVSSSSSGDGVRICKTAAQLEQARREYASVHGSIIVEQFITVRQNFGIQFGIPQDPRQPIEIIGVSEQLTTPEGEFIGGIIDPAKLFVEIDGVNRLLVETVLPAVRDMGWYGIGGFDVLIDREGKFYVDDPNFRMTGMSPYLCEARNGLIRTTIVSFIGTFRGTESDFLQRLGPLAQEDDPQQLMHIIGLTHRDNVFRMNAAMYFNQDDNESIQKNAQKLLALGVESKALKKLSENGRRHYPNFPEE